MKRVCTICARGGSKGVPNKNVRLLLGKPLIAYTAEHALESGLFDVVGVSSDSDEILQAAADAGVTELVKRPDEMADDHAPKEAAIRHAVLEIERRTGVEYDTMVDLDVTSPLRDVSDVIGAVKLLEDTPEATNVITATPARRSPYFNLVEVGVDGIVRLSKPPSSMIVRRQDSPKCYDMNASIYVWRRASLMASDFVFQEGTRLFVMPEERSIDIDSHLDFEFVEFLMRRSVSSAR